MIGDDLTTCVQLGETRKKKRNLWEKCGGFFFSFEDCGGKFCVEFFVLLIFIPI